jgi:hypothetical protein
MTTYETRLRGARKRLREAGDLARELGALDSAALIARAVKLIDEAMPSQPSAQADELVGAEG